MRFQLWTQSTVNIVTYQEVNLVAICLVLPLRTQKVMCSNTGPDPV